MKILLFVSVLAVLCCLGVLVAVIVAAKRRAERDQQDSPPRPSPRR